MQYVPLATEPGWLTDRCSVSQQLGALQTHNTDTFLFISHTTKVPLFKFRCNILIGVKITKEMPGSVASGTPCIYIYRVSQEECARLRESVPLTAVTHLLITKYILKLAGICGFCNVNSCT
jgi:hypothetical protein